MQVSIINPSVQTDGILKGRATNPTGREYILIDGEPGILPFTGFD